MKIDTILCPMDFSPSCESINEYASLLAKATSATIHYLHVRLPQVPYGSYEYVDPVHDEQQDLERLRKITPSQPDVSCKHAIEFGSPQIKILEYADQHQIDLIVMGTHGRSGLKRALLGSVAESVVRKSRCPVLALKSDSMIAASAAA